MKEHLQVLLAALDKANKQGVFNLQESQAVIQAYGTIEQALLPPTPPETEEKK